MYDADKESKRFIHSFKAIAELYRKCSGSCNDDYSLIKAGFWETRHIRGFDFGSDD